MSAVAARSHLKTIMTKCFAVTVTLAVVLAFSGTALAQKGGRSHGGSNAGSSSKSVHVKAYTKKNGTTVAAHDRKAPTPKSDAPIEASAAMSPPIRMYTDPISGRRTFTNAPSLAVQPVLPSRTIPIANTPVRAASNYRATTRATAKTVVPQPMGRPRLNSGVAVPRSADGRIQRSAAARHAFARQTGFPNGRPGYVIDHIKPLACGGADAPSNMQWQTIAAGKAKDKTERVGCR